MGIDGPTVSQKVALKVGLFLLFEPSLRAGFLD